MVSAELSKSRYMISRHNMTSFTVTVNTLNSFLGHSYFNTQCNAFNEKKNKCLQVNIRQQGWLAEFLSMHTDYCRPV